jgi:hypothetical protein
MAVAEARLPTPIRASDCIVTRRIEVAVAFGALHGASIRHE